MDAVKAVPGRPVSGKRRNVERAQRGFTLVELLVVISIIALLISILLPSLTKAREQAKSVKCAANVKSVGTAVATYQADSAGMYPPSYVYPRDEAGSWGINDGEQDPNRAYGYMHWSYFLHANGKVHDDAFQCPKMQDGGAPRTNPGPDARDWAPRQADDLDATTPSLTARKDKQASRMAYAANAAIMPRNKFTPTFSNGPRKNVLISENVVQRPGTTVLAAEYLDNYKALGVPQGNGLLIKSHRPINVFYHLGSGYNEYSSPVNTPYFQYGVVSTGKPRTAGDYGFLPLADVRDRENILDESGNLSQINAIGRHHPGGKDKRYGGTANFLFCDTHVERMTALESVERRYWGDKYYSLNGYNDVANYHPFP